MRRKLPLREAWDQRNAANREDLRKNTVFLGEGRQFWEGKGLDPNWIEMSKTVCRLLIKLGWGRIRVKDKQKEAHLNPAGHTEKSQSKFYSLCRASS